MATKKKTVKKAKASGTTKKTTAKATVKKTVKKVSKKKASSKAAVLKVEPPLTAEEVGHFAELLLAKRRELLGDVGCMEGRDSNGNQANGGGELSHMPIHMADIGTDTYEQEFTLGLIESERKRLREIDLAILKMQQSRYGICEGTAVQINRARLEAKPWARYCIDYARKIEQGLAEEILIEDAVGESIEQVQELSEDSA